MASLLCLLFQSKWKHGFAISKEKSSRRWGHNEVLCDRLPAFGSHPDLIFYYFLLTLLHPHWPLFLSHGPSSRPPHLLFLPPGMLLPKYPHGLLPHFLHVFTQMSPSQWGLPQPPYLKLTTANCQQLPDLPIPYSSKALIPMSAWAFVWFVHCCTPPNLE